MLLGKAPFLHRETKKYIKKATSLHDNFRNLEPGTTKHTQVRTALKIADKVADTMSDNDRVNNQIKKLEISQDRRKNLYAHIKQAKSKTSSIGPILDSDGTLNSSDQDMSNSFSGLLGDSNLPIAGNPLTGPSLIQIVQKTPLNHSLSLMRV